MSTYYDFESGERRCPACGWTGPGSDTTTGESFADGSDRHCPRCDHRFGYVAYPLLRESLTDPRAPEGDRAFAEIALRGAGTPANEDK